MSVPAQRSGLARLRRPLARRGLAVAALALALPLQATELQPALQAALAADPAIAAAQAQRDAAAAAVDVAAGKLNPQLTLQSTQQVLDQTTQGRTGGSEFAGITRNTQVQARLGLWRQRDRGTLALTRLQAAQADLQLARAQAEVFQRTAFAWLDVLGAQAVLQVHEGLARVAAEIERQARARLAAGNGTRDAVAEAQAQRLAAEAMQRESELDLAGKQRVFALVTRLPPQPFAPLRLSAAQGLTDTLSGDRTLLARVLEVNADIAVARLEEQVAEQRVRIARADHHPTLDLIAGHTEAQSDSTNTLGQRYRNNAVGLQLVLPLYAGGSVNAAERQAQAGVEAARAATRGEAQRLEAQFVADMAALEGLNRRVVGAQALLDAAREQRAAVDAAIVAGEKSLIELSAAQNLLARREADLLALQVQRGKLMARIAALLPAGDPVVLRWATAADQSVQR